MRSALVGGLLLLPSMVSAFSVIETDQSAPYEIVPVEMVPEEQVLFLGSLEGFPIMYEVTAEEPFTFTAQVRQLSTTIQRPFSLILIRQNDRGGGVTEVARMNTAPVDWTTQRDAAVGLSFAASPFINESVAAGTYRIEISTPENDGNYVLQLGDQPADSGYWGQLGAVRQIQQFFGFSVITMLGSSLVYYPLGCLLLIFLLYKTWQFRISTKRPESHVSY